MTEVKDETIEPKTNDVEQVEYKDIRYWVQQAGTNPAALKFPTDKWGFTSGIKKEVLKAASTVRGAQDKTDLILSVMAVLMQHIKLRQVVDAENRVTSRARYAEAAADRAPRERITASPVEA